MKLALHNACTPRGTSARAVPLAASAAAARTRRSPSPPARSQTCSAGTPHRRLPHLLRHRHPSIRPHLRSSALAGCRRRVGSRTRRQTAAAARAPTAWALHEPGQGSAIGSRGSGGWQLFGLTLLLRQDHECLPTARRHERGHVLGLLLARDPRHQLHVLGLKHAKRVEVHEQVPIAQPLDHRAKRLGVLRRQGREVKLAREKVARDRRSGGGEAGGDLAHRLVLQARPVLGHER